MYIFYSSDNKAKALKTDEGVSDTTLNAYQTTTPTGTEAYDSTYSTAYSAAAAAYSSAAAYSYAATPVQNQWAGYAATQPVSTKYDMYMLFSVEVTRLVL